MAKKSPIEENRNVCRKLERCLHFFEPAAFLFAENDFLGIFSPCQKPCGFAVPTGILDKD